MPVLANFVQIVGDSGRPIPQTEEGAEVVSLPGFNTGGRTTGTALLVYSVQNLAGSAQVLVNNNPVGAITASAGAVFSTQLIALSGAQLNDGNNEIVLRNVTDPFRIKDLICFFHQDSG